MKIGVKDKEGKKVPKGKGNEKIKDKIKEKIIPTLAKDLDDFEKTTVIYMLQGTGKDKKTGKYGQGGMVYPSLSEAQKALNLDPKEYKRIIKEDKYKKAMSYAGKPVLSTSKIPMNIIKQLKTDKDLHNIIREENDTKKDILFDLTKKFVRLVRKDPSLADGINHLFGVQSDYQGHWIRKVIPFVSFTDPSLLQEGIHDEHYSKSLSTTRFLQSIIEKAKKKSYTNKELQDDLEGLWKGMARGIVNETEGKEFDKSKKTGEQTYISESPMGEVFRKIEEPSLHWLLPHTTINPTSDVVSLDKIQPTGRILASKPLSKEFNKMLERSKGIKAEAEYSEARAIKLGEKKGFQAFIPYSAEDYLGLIYPTLGKGKQGR